MKPANAEAAVASCILASNTSRVERSTSTPTEDFLPAPSQSPGITRSGISCGRTWILTISGIWPRQARAAALTQADDELAAQFTARLRVDGCVDGFVGRVALGLTKEGSLQRTCNPLGRPLPVEHGQHQALAQSIWRMLAMVMRSSCCNC